MEKRKRKEKAKRGQGFGYFTSLAYDVIAPYSVEECISRLRALQKGVREVTTVDVVYSDEEKQLIVVDIRKFHNSIPTAGVIILPSYHQEGLSLLKLQTTLGPYPYVYLLIAAIFLIIASLRDPSFWWSLLLFAGIIGLAYLYIVRERDNLVNLVLNSLDAYFPEQADTAEYD